MIGDLILLERENERLREENSRYKTLLDEIQKMGCVYKNNMTGCPGCYIAIELSSDASTEPLLTGGDME